MLEKLQNNPFHMNYFAIKKEYQNQGLGTNALKILLNDVIKEKGLCIEIEKVIDDLPNTLKRASFYERLDFKSTNSTYKLFNVLYTPYYWSKDIVYSKIEKAGDINYLIKYGRVVFNVKDLAQYVKDSIYINPSIDNNINNVYEIAKKTINEKTEIIPELTDEWYNRLFFPIGIDPDNNINIV